MPRITILGGAGAMALATIHDLLETAGETLITLADRDEAAARERVRGLNDPRLAASLCDARDPDSLHKVCRDSDLVISCINAGNLVACQRAALDAGAHYIDLGSWPDETAAQLAMGPDFHAADRIAVLGAGSAPGISNVMAAAAVTYLESVRSLDIKLAKVYPSPSRLPLNPPYALPTILDELTVPPTILQKGKLIRVPPRSGREIMSCPEPMGEVEVMHVIHPEPFTFARSFADKGLREASFKIGLPREFLQRLQLLLALGLGEDREIEVGGVPVNLRELLLILAVPFRSEVIEESQPPQDYGYTLVVARGVRSGRPVEVRAELFGRRHQRWGLSGGTVRTGVPASVVAQMILCGAIRGRGCFAPEQCVPPRPFFSELARRGMEVYVTVREAMFDPR